MLIFLSVELVTALKKPKLKFSRSLSNTRRFLSSYSPWAIGGSIRRPSLAKRSPNKSIKRVQNGSKTTTTQQQQQLSSTSSSRNNRVLLARALTKYGDPQPFVCCNQRSITDRQEFGRSRLTWLISCLGLLPLLTCFFAATKCARVSRHCRRRSRSLNSSASSSLSLVSSYIALAVNVDSS